MKRAAGYVRVSSRTQAEKGESLETQRKAIRAYAEAHDWNLIDIYADEGISGADTKKRPEFQRLIADAEAKMFDIIIVHNLSRFSRKLMDNLTYVPLLKNMGVDFVSITEHIDLSSPAGELIFNIFSSLADFYRKEIRQRMHENKVARAKRGVPVAGKLPIGRRYDKETGEWSLDDRIADLLRWTAREYLDKDRPLKDLAHILKSQYDLPISYSHIHEILTQKCGDTFVVHFESEPDPIVYTIPRILEDDTIRALKERIAFNRTWNRTDAKYKYLFSGFIRCAECGIALIGQTQKSAHGKFNYHYYRHFPSKESRKGCGGFSSIKTARIENAVLRTIFESTGDKVGFKEAIKESLPDAKYLNKIQKNIAKDEKRLKEIEQGLAKLVEAVLDGTLKKGTITEREEALYKAKAEVEDRLIHDRAKLKALPSKEEVASQAERIRLIIQDHFGSEERLKEMTFKEKRRLLRAIFNGKDEDGQPFGIYIKKRGQRMWDYTISAKLLYGTRTLNGDDIDFIDDALMAELKEDLDKKFVSNLNTM